MFRTAFLIILTLYTCAAAQVVRPFDLVEQGSRPFMDEGDPLAFPLKVHTLASGSYKFWRGSKDLYYAWAKQHAADWIADDSNYLISHGDLHFGNIGTYPSVKFGQLAFGLVDFDESARTPMQLEVMQGLITLRLTARHNQLLLSEPQQVELAQTLVTAYRQGLTGKKTAGEWLADEPLVKKLFEDEGKDYVKGELKKATQAGRFIPATFWKDGDLKGQPKDLFRPAMHRADELADGIQQAIANSPELAELCRFRTVADIRPTVKDAVQRTRIGSSGSQGLRKYLILLDRPFKGIDHDVVLYLKQEIPSAADRAGFARVEKHSPGRRTSTDYMQLVSPRPLFSSWCEIGSESYWVTFKEPWSNELSPDDFADYETLKAGARIWGLVAGASHHAEANRQKLADRLTPEQADLLRRRSDAFLQRLEMDLIDFTRDPRTAALRQRAIRAMAEQSNLSR